MSMQVVRMLTRPFRVRRTVRLRLTGTFAILFILAGAALLAIASGLVVGKSTSQVAPASAQPQPRLGLQARLALAENQIRSLRAQLQASPGQGSPSLSHQLFLSSLIALGIMAVVAALLGWLFAGRALRPLRVITATARRISEDNLDERLAFSGPQDELKDLADTIDGLLARLESAFGAQRRFVANASHELRTPLATMRASLDVAMAKPEPPPVQTVLLADRLRAELDRIDELLEGFLVLARAQHGALPDLAVVSVGDLASAALAVRSGVIAAKALTVQAEVSPAGSWVAGSQALVSRMVDNIIDNAIVHNERAGWLRVAVGPVGTATVAAGTGATTTGATTTSSRWACVVVENGGPVLDQAQVDQLAQPFRRLGPSGVSTGRIATGGGSGLGLSIVAAIAAAHGGTLDLCARPDGGLRVVVSLPLAAEAALTGAPT
ncbi:MAG TPA: HAMP domain-containing sensor histidine kinase [Streptosporangiaceae bacterium]|jgi:signal transduction histidine kinase|nr:HAMP domain-containing sensor histidine kinase [Streptosporangiaceae bacterium]